VIDVIDDGRGIDPERIRAVAVKRGLVGENDVVDQQRAQELIFTPGFSTASAVSEISGRGVGLDVVKKNIQELKGTIDIVTTLGVAGATEIGEGEIVLVVDVGSLIDGFGGRAREIRSTLSPVA